MNKKIGEDETIISNGNRHSIMDEDRKRKRKFWHNVRVFVFCLAALQFVQVMGSGYSKSVLTSIERRFQLNTFEIGVLQSCFHIGNLSIILLVSYFGSKWHRPRAIAIGSVVMAISSLLSALPQFIGGCYVPQYAEIKSTQIQSEHATTLAPARLAPISVAGQNMNISTSHFSRNPRKRKSGDNVARTTETSKRQFGRSSVCNRDEITGVWKTSTSAKQINETLTNESSFYIIIAVGGVLKGMGHTPLHPLGMSFIDDFAAQGNSAFYIGIVSALSLLGPAFGFLLGSFTTNIWVDTGWVSNPLKYSDDYAYVWVGAWWMGYLLIAALLLLASIPFYSFPRKLKVEDDDVINTCAICVNGLKFRSVDLEEKKNQTENLLNGTENSTSNGRFTAEKNYGNNLINMTSSRTISFSGTDTSFKQTMSAVEALKRVRSAPAIARLTAYDHNGLSQHKYFSSPSRRELSGRLSLSIRDFFFTSLNLVSDPMFASITMGYVSLTSFLAASITYMSKYMETQFQSTASSANLINGSVNLPLAVLGNVAGGMIIRTRNLNVKQTVGLVLASLLVTLMCVGALLLFGCDGPTVVGVDDASHCYDECNCTDDLRPVCDVSTNVTYKSACLARCLRELKNNTGYTDCGCLINHNHGVAQLTNGYCQGKNNCSGTLLFFIFMMGTASLSSGMAATPSTLSILRVAPSSEKALAIGVVFVFTRVLAWIPSPVYIGRVIDSSCLLWSPKEQNSYRKHCEIYNKRWLRHRMFGAIALQLLCAIFFYFVSYYLASRREARRFRADVQTVVASKERVSLRETSV